MAAHRPSLLAGAVLALALAGALTVVDGPPGSLTHFQIDVTGHIDHISKTWLTLLIEISQRQGHMWAPIGRAYLFS